MALIATKTKRAAARRKIELREKFWPGATESHLWDRHNRDGQKKVAQGQRVLHVVVSTE